VISELQLIDNDKLYITPLKEVGSSVVYLSESKSCWITIEWLSEELMAYATENYQTLFNIHPLQRGKVVMFNNEECVSPRWHRSYLHQPIRNTDRQHSYMYSGSERFEDLSLPIPFQKFLYFLNKRETSCPYNQMIVNWYETGNDYIAPHSDCEEGILPTTGIAIISLCEDEKAPRVLSLRPKKLKDGKNDNLYNRVNIQMNHGCIITMYGDTQKRFKHSIPKALDNSTSRISLTFRKF
jgi:alkylated DNA repair dioxygenase AlkB